MQRTDCENSESSENISHLTLGEESNCRKKGTDEMIHFISHDSDNDMINTFESSDGSEKIYGGRGKN
jgi:hypothetical protein